MMRIAATFLKKDFLTDISYRFNFIAQLLTILLKVTAIYFVGSIVGKTEIKALEPYGGNYFAFLLIGIILFNYIGISTHSFANSIREGQMIGTLEIMLVSPVTLPAILLYSSIWNYLFSTIKIAIYLSVAVIFFGLNLGNANVPAFLLILFLSILSFASIGILYASFVMVIKKGESIMMLVTAVTMFLGGIVFPVDILPPWLRVFSDIIPLTYGLECARLSLLQGLSIIDLSPQILSLVLFCVILLPSSLTAFYFAVKRAKVVGTLAQY